MPKKNKLAFTLSMVVYPFDLRLSFSESDEEIKKYFSNTNVKDEWDDKTIQYSTDISPARCIMFECGAALLRLRKIPQDAGDFGTLQHEISHYVFFLLGHKIGMKHSLKTTEAYSYLTGYITTEIYNRIWKK